MTMNPSPSAREAARQREIDEWLDDHCGGADIFIQGQCHGYSIPAVRELLRAFSRRAAALSPPPPTAESRLLSVRRKEVAAEWRWKADNIVRFFEKLGMTTAQKEEFLAMELADVYMAAYPFDRAAAPVETPAPRMEVNAALDIIHDMIHEDGERLDFASDDKKAALEAVLNAAQQYAARASGEPE